MKFPPLPERSWSKTPSKWFTSALWEIRDHPHQAPGLPEWMSREAVEEIGRTDAQDPDHGKAWWGHLWATAGDARKDREFMLAALAMAVVYGWPEVSRDLVKNGAPLGKVSRGGPKWKHLEAAYQTMPEVCVLDLVVPYMEVSTASHPVHPKHLAGLQTLVDMGADPNDMAYSTQFMTLRCMRVGALLAKAGWNPANPGKRYTKEEPTHIVHHLIGNDLTLSHPCRAQMLGEFIKNGMPLSFPGDKQNLIERLANSVAGLHMLPTAMTHPDKEGLARALRQAEPLLRKKADRMNDKDRGEFLAKMEIFGLEAATPQVAPRARISRM